MQQKFISLIDSKSNNRLLLDRLVNKLFIKSIDDCLREADYYGKPPAGELAEREFSDYIFQKCKKNFADLENYTPMQGEKALGFGIFRLPLKQSYCTNVNKLFDELNHACGFKPFDEVAFCEHATYH